MFNLYFFSIIRLIAAQKYFMDKTAIITKTEGFVKEYLSDKESGHNWWHIYRVRNNAMYIYRKELRGDPLIIELAALLHDIGDDKIDSDTDGKAVVRAFLEDLSADQGLIAGITFIMENISFRDSFNGSVARSPELDIVQDADRLDAIGAIGIARAFNYGGSRNNEIYNPGIKTRSYGTKEEYSNSDSSTINHFYEKLLKLKGMMNTDTGKALAAERHSYMESFLDQFYREWSVTD